MTTVESIQKKPDEAGAASPLADLPPTAQVVLAPASDAREAELLTARLAHSHYENFSVVSALLPNRLRQDFCNVYAFCRVSERQPLSDKTCTALQLTNFWQDVRRDILDRDRIYPPRDSMANFGVTVDQIRQGRCDENYRNLIRYEVDRAAALFDEGEPLLSLLDRSVRPQISLFLKGGRAILDAIRRQNYDTLSRRPRLSKWQKYRLVLTTMTASLVSS